MARFPKSTTARAPSKASNLFIVRGVGATEIISRIPTKAFGVGDGVSADSIIGMVSDVYTNSAEAPGAKLIGVCDTLTHSDSKNIQSVLEDLDRAIGQISEGGGVTDHGSLSGLQDDDHNIYLLISGARAMSGDLIGTDFVKTRGGTVSRTDGFISGVSLVGGRTLTINRDENGYVSSISDGTRVYSITRDENNSITGWSVS